MLIPAKIHQSPFPLLFTTAWEAHFYGQKKTEDRTAGGKYSCHHVQKGQVQILQGHGCEIG